MADACILVVDSHVHIVRNVWDHVSVGQVVVGSYSQTNEIIRGDASVAPRICLWADHGWQEYEEKN